MDQVGCSKSDMDHKGGRGVMEWCGPGRVWR